MRKNGGGQAKLRDDGSPKACPTPSRSLNGRVTRGPRPCHTLATAATARGSYACPAQLVSPGVYGTQGSNRPGVSTYRCALVHPISEVKKPRHASSFIMRK